MVMYWYCIACIQFGYHYDDWLGMFADLLGLLWLAETLWDKEKMLWEEFLKKI
jgi:hypothetical protein